MLGADDHSNWDDAHLVDSGYLYRRIKRVKDCVIRNPSGEGYCLLPNAFIYDHQDIEGRGLSVSSGQAAEELDVSIDAVNPNWETHALAYFPVSVVRAAHVSALPDAKIGVIRDPTESDPSHSLVRCNLPVPMEAIDAAKIRRIWKPLRSKLCDSAIYVDAVDRIIGFPAHPRIKDA